MQNCRMQINEGSGSGSARNADLGARFQICDLHSALCPQFAAGFHHAFGIRKARDQDSHHLPDLHDLPDPSARRLPADPRTLS